MATIFSKIIKGEIPCHKIAEDDLFLAFLDISPLAKGHTLVVPKMENDYIFDLDDATLASMMVFSKKVANALEKPCPAGVLVLLLLDSKCRIPTSILFLSMGWPISTSNDPSCVFLTKQWQRQHRLSEPNCKPYRRINVTGLIS